MAQKEPWTGRQIRTGLWVGLVLLLGLIQYAGRASSGTPDRNALYLYSTAVGGAIAYGIILLAVLAIAGFNRDLLCVSLPTTSWRRTLGMAVLLLVGIYVAVAIMDPFLHGGKEQGLTPTGWQGSHAGAYAANFVVVAVLAPIVEELTYRGLGLTLLARLGHWPSIVAIGCVFAFDHGLVQAFPELALFGAALAWFRLRVKSVFPGMLVHGSFNAIALIVAVVA